ncbi:hypothetical protein DL771_003130 [Monosporascus sp. 5C6A]|nr:hypothetical protein DL771_003130 [Monosporascus sp. 5C6A]
MDGVQPSAAAEAAGPVLDSWLLIPKPTPFPVQIKRACPDSSLTEYPVDRIKRAKTSYPGLPDRTERIRELFDIYPSALVERVTAAYNDPVQSTKHASYKVICRYIRRKPHFPSPKVYAMMVGHYDSLRVAVLRAMDLFERSYLSDYLCLSDGHIHLLRYFRWERGFPGEEGRGAWADDQFDGILFGSSQVGWLRLMGGMKDAVRDIYVVPSCPYIEERTWEAYSAGI